jgi:iron complex outermembrane receptor protein
MVLNLPIGRSRPAPAPSPDDGAPSTGDGEDGAPPMPRGMNGPRAQLLLSANHTIILENDIFIRPGLAPVDLLDGGAIGIAGGRSRHLVDFNIALTDRGLGINLTGSWRSPTEIETRIGGVPDRLRFGALATANLRAFTDAQRLFPQVRWLRGTRFTVSVFNLANERQRVTDSSGNTPLQYQPAYRDPVGRTVEFEIRRVF